MNAANATFDFRALRKTLGVTFTSGCTDEGYPCALCGKACPNPTHRVRFIEGGLSTVATGEYADLPENGPGDMGYYPVGPGCMRKIKKTVSAEDFNRFFRSATT